MANGISSNFCFFFLHNLLHSIVHAPYPAFMFTSTPFWILILCKAFTSQERLLFDCSCFVYRTVSMYNLLPGHLANCAQLVTLLDGYLGLYIHCITFEQIGIDGIDVRLPIMSAKH